MRDIKFSCMWFNGSRWMDLRYTLEEMESGLHWDAMSDQPLLRKFVLKAKRQYTGLKDKNNFEIYEGDILTGMRHKPIGSRAEVVFDSRLLTFLTINDLGEVYYIAQEGEDIEVLGNIYSDPELLEPEYA